MAGKRLPSETRIARDVEQVLAARLPSGWALRAETDVPVDRYRIDVLIEIASPDGATAALAVEVKRLLDPRLVP